MMTTMAAMMIPVCTLRISCLKLSPGANVIIIVWMDGCNATSCGVMSFLCVKLLELRCPECKKVAAQGTRMLKYSPSLIFNGIIYYV